ncbi:MAG: DUF4159 domain-containing protein, partial [Alphaproteobacteria bacterium]|nr:DUF4159 domain-containing protein [Alphaproteobacteria bacterium]
LLLVPTTLSAKPESLQLLSPNEARTAARALKPQPFAPDHVGTLSRLTPVLRSAQPSGASVIWMHDGIDRGKVSQVFATGLSELATGGVFITLDSASDKQPLGVFGNVGENGKLQATLLRPGGAPRAGTVVALSTRSERLAEATFQLTDGAKDHTVTFDLPLELRNQVARVEVSGERSAAAINLLDGRSHWQRVGLISGGGQEQAQPILSPLYYVEKALKPFAEIIRSKDANLAAGLEDLLSQNITVLVLTDIGTLPEGVREQVEAWLKKGGVLVRFAGPRMEKGGDDLLPAPLRIGGRTLGGALSWSTPQQLAAFDAQSLFHGLEPQIDVTVRRQVLADPARMSADVKVLARLQDGTPLVTAKPMGQGQVILFHITANSDWSNLPISGLFVEMLKRISTLGTLSAAAETSATKSEAEPRRASNRAAGGAGSTPSATSGTTLAPVETLDGFGNLQPPPPTAEALSTAKLPQDQRPSLAHPPGYYGSPAAPRALNVLNPKSELQALDVSAANPEQRSYENRAALALKPWVLTAALALLFADIIAVLVLQLGGLRMSDLSRGAKTSRAGVAGLIAAASVVAIDARPAYAQGVLPDTTGESGNRSPDAIGQMATSKVTFGYVLTGDAKTDRISRLGLEGLVQVLTVRTAVEPGKPIGVDIAKDEIAFYPILYWPVLSAAKPLKNATLAKIDAFMKQGGMIIFDTRDYGAGLPTGMPVSGEGGTALQRLLGRLDVPRVEPVPDDHVLTKSFYLLRTFPGRWDGGQMWVEAEGEIDAGDQRKARRADGVTSILITSNDLASAWALDKRGRGLYPTVPGGEEQREMAFRTGVNIVMHALTGNYKADQVHVPSLLERLGQ